MMSLFEKIEKASSGTVDTDCSDTNESKNCTLVSNPEIPKPIDYVSAQNGARKGDNFMGGDLDLFWAQSITGADLARELVDGMEESKDKKVPVAVIDTAAHYDALDGIPAENINREVSTFYQCKNEMDCLRIGPNHGNSVANLIAGKKVGGISPEKVILSMNSTEVRDNEPAADQYEKIFTNYEKSSSPIPKFINSSESWNDTKGQIPKKLAEMNAKNGGTGPIMVTISHNSYPEPVEEAKKNPHSILVGNSSIWGTSVGSSQEDEDVVISAPSDEWVLSAGRNDSGKLIYNSHGGTSNAAPQVTGALANVALLKPDLTRDQSVRLLKKTAYPSYVSGNKNGAGVLNSYKMAKVLAKIVTQCKSSKDKSICENDLLAQDSTFEFSDERKKKKEILENAKSLLQNINNVTDQCDLVQSRFKALREMSLLFPDDIEIAEMMGNIYKAQGLKTSARFYEGLVAHGKKPPLSTYDWLLSQWDTMTDYEKANYALSIRKMNGGELSSLIDKLTNPQTKIPPSFWQNLLFKFQSVVNPIMTDDQHMKLLCIVKNQPERTEKFNKDLNSYIRKPETKALYDKCPNP